MKTVIRFDHSKKEAIDFMNTAYKNAIYIGVYKYSKGKGNNFYEFKVSE